MFEHGIPYRERGNGPTIKSPRVLTASHVFELAVQSCPALQVAVPQIHSAAFDAKPSITVHAWYGVPSLNVELLHVFVVDVQNCPALHIALPQIHSTAFVAAAPVFVQSLTSAHV